jgi:hypothetical protein
VAIAPMTTLEQWVRVNGTISGFSSRASRPFVPSTGPSPDVSLSPNRRTRSDEVIGAVVDVDVGVASWRESWPGVNPV